ncbi:heterochromatin protein 1-like isoform X2 [Uranotaenia lowii]|uniref:heterochromatin protein 1-like isoform X2 n=1 Tax=Uranotaenia lowii TaxID=190385 RepID=UPI002479A4D0|nr:heterochromatin protein 1-like isoform X2 [Uranotaenia lowii]
MSGKKLSAAATPEKEYIVERVLGRCVRRSGAKYIIKRKGAEDVVQHSEVEKAVPKTKRKAKPQTQEQDVDNTGIEKPNTKVKKVATKPTIKLNINGSNRAPRKNQKKNTNASQKPSSVTSKQKTPQERNNNTKLTKGNIDKPTMGNNDKPTGFDRQQRVEEIIGIIEEHGELSFLLKWRGIEVLEMVPSKVVREHVPEMVIDFFEARIIWT